MDGSASATGSLSRMYRAITKEPVQATAADRELVRRLATLEEHLDEAKGRRQRLRNELQARMGPATHLQHGSDVLARLTRPSRSNGARRLTVIRQKESR